MNLLPLILTGITIAIALGGLAVFFKKGGDKEASELDQNTIRAYKESEIVLNRTIESLRIQLQTKEDIIERLVKDGRSSKKSRK